MLFRSGGFGNDTLNGASGGAVSQFDILIGGLYLDYNGSGQKAILPDSVVAGFYGITTPVSDTFVLGNANGNFYAGGAGGVLGSNVVGFDDRADILSFENGVDKIQVNGSVVPATFGSNTLILAPSGSNYEVIAQVVGFTGSFAADTFIPAV